jgi:hypothetical protein
MSPRLTAFLLLRTQESRLRLAPLPPLALPASEGVVSRRRAAERPAQALPGMSANVPGEMPSRSLCRHEHWLNRLVRKCRRALVQARVAWRRSCGFKFRGGGVTATVPSRTAEETGSCLSSCRQRAPAAALTSALSLIKAQSRAAESEPSIGNLRSCKSVTLGHRSRTNPPVCRSARGPGAPKNWDPTFARALLACLGKPTYREEPTDTLIGPLAVQRAGFPTTQPNYAPEVPLNHRTRPSDSLLRSARFLCWRETGRHQSVRKTHGLPAQGLGTGLQRRKSGYHLPHKPELRLLQQ